MQENKGEDGGLAPHVRMLAILGGALLVINGLPLFFAPMWAAANFSWRIAPFVAMTMGGWSLGGAFYAWEVIRRPRWATAYSSLIYMGAFGLMETIILWIHRDVLHLEALLGWPYLILLIVLTVTGVAAGIDWLGKRPSMIIPGDAKALWWMRVAVVVFSLLVGFLGVVLLSGGAHPGKNIFPDDLSAFTSHAFGAFYSSLVIAIIPLLWAKSRAPMLAYMKAGLALVVVIMIAAGVYLPLFDFQARPGGLIYIGAYMLALVGSVAILGYDMIERRSGGKA